MIRAPPMILQAVVICTSYTQAQASQNYVIDGADGFRVPANMKKLLAVNSLMGVGGIIAYLRQSQW